MQELTQDEKDKRDFHKDLAAPSGSIKCKYVWTHRRLCNLDPRVRALEDKSVAVASGLANCGLEDQEASMIRF